MGLCEGVGVEGAVVGAAEVGVDVGESVEG